MFIVSGSTVGEDRSGSRMEDHEALAAPEREGRGDDLVGRGQYRLPAG